MRRKELTYLPKWEGSVERVALKFSAQFARQTSPLFEKEDLLHEAYITYRRVKTKYLGKAKNEAWFVALFKKSLERDFWKLANRIYERNSSNRPIEGIEHDVPDSNETLGYLLVALEQAPNEVKETLKLVLTEKHDRRNPPADGAYTNAEICSRLELSSKYNLATMIKFNLS